MSECLHIAVVQCELFWENPSRNRAQIEAYLKSISNANVIVLPEMFTTGFSVQSVHLAEFMDGPTVKWMKNMAQKYSAAICGSIMIKESESIYNRFFWVEPRGLVKHYDKRHLFGLVDEGKYFTAGTKRIIIEYKGWKICPLICYDLRFPVFSRNDVNYDILLYVANWPHKRIKAWDSLLQARAIENQCYVVAANRVGVDGYKAQYSGHSQLIDGYGELIAIAPDNEEGIIESRLDKKHLESLRKRLPFLDDRDQFKVID